VNGFYDHASDLWLSKIKRRRACVVEKTIHCQKSLAGCCAWWKAAARRKTAVQAPG
jgi:hypothetical protein